MASVSSLDQDMRNLRMSRYTPQAAKEVRAWIEETLNERLAPGDLLDALKDGVALCKLVNLVMPSPGIKYKASPMPFIQMENISHFLKACEMPPLSMPAHDRFLTVDLYESKDPAQVLQCLSAFSRQAHAVKPSVVRTTIGPKKAGGVVSPTNTGGANGSAGWGQPPASFGRSPSPTKMSAAMPSSNSARALSPSLTGGSNGSQKAEGTRSPTGPVSSWSNKSDEVSSAPAWNIHQYGYMGGASQGNQGISFGARRQITSQAPSVPSLVEKQRVRKEKEAEEERARLEAEEKKRRDVEAEEERARMEEERRWEEETKKVKDDERRHIEEQKRQWEEQERRWQEDEVVRKREAEELQRLQKKPPEKPRVPSSGILRGQTLSQYQKEQAAISTAADPNESPEQKRVRELEKQLEEARERERQYQAERGTRSRPSTSQTETHPDSANQSESSWTGDEREQLRKEWQSNQAPSLPQRTQDTRPLPQPAPAQEDGTTETDETPPLPSRMQPSTSASSLPPRMQPSNSANSLNPASAPHSSPLGTPNRPLPTPDKEFKPYTPPRISASTEAGDTSLEQSRDRDARLASQVKTKAGGFSAKSLLEKEMERERERQREWEAGQAETKNRTPDVNEGTGHGQTWDVNQYGYMGGDGMNKGSSAGSGINFGGRRQILGPREMGKR